jgi:hypothetical protein
MLDLTLLRPKPDPMGVDRVRPFEWSMGRRTRRGEVEQIVFSSISFLFEHVLFAKPVPTLQDIALSLPFSQCESPQSHGAFC